MRGRAVPRPERAAGGRAPGRPGGLFFEAFHDGVDLDDETADDQDRGQRDAAPREHGVVEFVGRIAAAAGHQHEAQEDDGEPDGQQNVVAAGQGHTGIFLFRRGVIGFFHLIKVYLVFNFCY